MFTATLNHMIIILPYPEKLLFKLLLKLKKYYKYYKKFRMIEI